MLDVKAREGDLVETSEGLIFDVKGLVHPHGRIVAFIRYYPNENGDRKRNRLVYGKVYSFPDRYILLKKRFPKYVVYDPVFDEILCEVPVSDAKKRLDPVEKLVRFRSCRILDPLQSKALQLAQLLRKTSKIPWSAIGISGSLLAGLHTASSDIDPIIYGSANCRRVYSALREMLDDPSSLFKPYSKQDLKSLFDFRSKDTVVGFEDFDRTESRKASQGKFMGTGYFVRFVKDWSEFSERYGDIQYKNSGYVRIKATIGDDSESIFTPCKYMLEKATIIDGPRIPSITEIVSFRGRFCEQAKNGETIIAQGKVERVTDLKRHQEYFRLLIGNKPSDYMVLA